MSLPKERLRQFTDLMTERGWDRLLFYGNSWRKDFFRYLLNVNFSGPWAIASLDRSGEITATFSDPWDAELDVGRAILPAADFGGAGFSLQPGLQPRSGRRLKPPLQAKARSTQPSVAVAGLELMDAGLAESLTANPVSATAEIEEMRRVKSPEEIECLRRAAALADRGYEYFAQIIEPGMAEYELVAEVEGFLKSHGAEDNFMLIASGGTEVMGMRPPTQRRFKEGDQVTTELTPQIGGYYAQICRTLVLGEPSAEQRQAFGIFSEARKAAEDLLKPGVDLADIARAQNDVFREHGYGEYTGSKYTRVRGHNLGLHPDETPYVLEDVHYTVKPGMAIIAHPNTYLPLSGYMVFGDTLLVTETGCEPLNRAERKLFHPEGQFLKK